MFSASSGLIRFHWLSFFFSSKQRTEIREDLRRRCRSKNKRPETQGSSSSLQLPDSTPLKDTPLGGIRTGGQGVLRSSRAIRAFVLNSLDYKYTLRDKDKATDEYHELQAKVRNYFGKR
jgi:hypothetical protein